MNIWKTSFSLENDRKKSNVVDFQRGDAPAGWSWAAATTGDFDAGDREAGDLEVFDA